MDCLAASPLPAVGPIGGTKCQDVGMLLISHDGSLCVAAIGCVARQSSCVFHVWRSLNQACDEGCWNCHDVMRGVGLAISLVMRGWIGHQACGEGLN